jgi:hypothetical protein
MKKEYDFSKAEKGKFYRKGARFCLPIYLDPKLQEQLVNLAEKKGRGISDIVKSLLKRDMELIKDLA